LDILSGLDVAAPWIHSRGQCLTPDVEVGKNLTPHTLDDLDLAVDLGEAVAAGEANVLEVLGSHPHDDLLATAGAGLGQDAVLDWKLKAIANQTRLAVAANLDVQEVHGRAAD